MGVTVRRIGGALLLLVALLLPLRMRNQRVVPETTGESSDRLWQLIPQERTARLRWSALTERDSALAVISALATPNATPAIHLQGFAAGASAPGPEAAVAKLWASIGRADSTVGVGVVLYNAASYGHQAWWNLYLGALVTRRSGVTWCIPILPAEARADARVMIASVLLDSGIAPCAVLAAFGPPGPAVSSWLEETRYVAVHSNDWLTHPGELVDRSGMGPWVFWGNWDRSEPGLARSGFSLLEMPFVEPLGSLLSPPHPLGAPGIRCLDGNRDSCVQGVLHPAIVSQFDHEIMPDLTMTATLVRMNRVNLTMARPPNGFLLSSLIREKGRERFRAFWKSERSFEAAFQEAFGESLGEWTARWAKREWLASWDAKYRSREILLGATLKPSWPLLAAGWTLAALLLAGFAARRRQVT